MRTLTLEEHRILLADLHHEISNQGGREGELFQRAFLALFALTVEYLKPDSHPGVTVELEQ